MAELIFELSINLIETFITVEFITRYLGCKYSDNKKIFGFLCGWSAAFIELCVINYITEFERFASVIPIAIYFTYAIFFLEGSVLLKLWVSSLAQMILLLIAIIVNLLVCNFIGYDPNSMISVFNSVRVISVILTKIILFYVTRIILKNRYKNPIDNHTWFMLILIPIISIFSLISLMMAALNHEEIKAYILCGMAGIIIADIVTYYFFVKMNKDHEAKQRITLLEMQNENARKNIENMNAFVAKIKSTRHDMKNQLLIIDNYISAEKYSEASNYIKELTDEHLPDLQNFSNTGNVAFDAIVNSKIALCNQKNIYIEVRVMHESIKSIDPIDTGILFGNLIDNAIEAAENTKEKRITIDVQEQGAYLSILITNSISESVLENNKSLKTSKNNTEFHGIGISSVKTIIKKYDGMIQFFEKNNEFCCHILLDVDKC